MKEETEKPRTPVVRGARRAIRTPAHTEAFFLGSVRRTREFLSPPQSGKRQGNPRRRDTRPTNASAVHPFSTCHVRSNPTTIFPSRGPCCLPRPGRRMGREAKEMGRWTTVATGGRMPRNPLICRLISSDVAMSLFYTGENRPGFRGPTYPSLRETTERNPGPAQGGRAARGAALVACAHHGTKHKNDRCLRVGGQTCGGKFVR
jgi:hypothetical protein